MNNMEHNLILLPGLIIFETEAQKNSNASSIRIRNSHLSRGLLKAPYFNFVVENKKLKH
jgi:hypothetical protein